VEHLESVLDDLRHLDALLFSPEPALIARGWLLGLGLSLTTAVLTVLVSALLASL
jgi:hypothetical protein